MMDIKIDIPIGVWILFALILAVILIPVGMMVHWVFTSKYKFEEPENEELKDEES
jgi:hypothetical protein